MCLRISSNHIRVRTRLQQELTQNIWIVQLDIRGYAEYPLMIKSRNSKIEGDRVVAGRIFATGNKFHSVCLGNHLGLIAGSGINAEYSGRPDSLSAKCGNDGAQCPRVVKGWDQYCAIELIFRDCFWNVLASRLRDPQRFSE